MRYTKNYDIIHAYWTLSAAAVWVSRFYHNRPFIVTVQGSDIFQATRIPFVRPITRTVLSQSERVLALSQSLARATIALGVDPNQVEIVPHGVNTDKFQPVIAVREPLVLFVGSLIERKGLKYLIQAMPRVLQKFHEVRLVIVGEGPQESILLNLTRALGVANNVLFVGAQSQDQISRWMQLAKVFVLPSLEEGLGVVLLEALASGTPCVATRIGGIQDIISPEVGILVAPADSAALADAIITVLEDQKRWNMMSYNARSHAVEHYSWNSIASCLINIYQDIINRQEGKTEK